MSFGAAPGALVALALALVAALVVRVASRPRPAHADLGRTAIAHPPWRRRVVHGAYIAGLLLCAVAAMRPRVRAPGRWQQHGIDLVLALDFSDSMLARDVHPDRLQRMTRAVEELIDRSIDHRVAVVVFAGAAAYVPLTHDREVARSMFRGMDPAFLGPGSDLEEAVLVGRCLARANLGDDPGCRGIGGRGRGGEPIPAMTPDSDGAPGEGGILSDEARQSALASRAAWAEERARALVIFTDGEETRGDARDEVARAAALGVEVFIVAVGTVPGAPVPDLDPGGRQIGWKTGADGAPVRSRLDLGRLASLAKLAGGPDRLFFIGAAGRSSDDLAQRLDQLQRGSLAGKSVTRYRDVYPWFLVPGLLLLGIEACASARPRRSRDPERHGSRA